MIASTIVLQAAGAGGMFGSVSSFLPILLIIVVFYFFMIRPQIKKQKDQKKFTEDLKKGDKVVTTSGAHGRIVEVADTTFLIEGESGHKTRYDRSAISLDASRALNAPPKA
jgi:preprotein translocase subunit YajC